MKPKAYRDIIDALVEVCHTGQGQIGPDRVREGVWAKNVSSKRFPDYHQINLMLKKLSQPEREILAGMLSNAFEGGVFETLKALEQFEISPFETGYEGSPYHDFIGRLNDWEWPTE